MVLAVSMKGVQTVFEQKNSLAGRGKDRPGFNLQSTSKKRVCGLPPGPGASRTSEIRQAVIPG